MSKDDRVSEIRSLVALEKELKIEKLRHEINFEAARVEGAHLELAAARDKEADRLARPGSRDYRQLNIFSGIYGSHVDEWIDRLEHWERRDPGEAITIRINSPGGSVLDGYALFDTILRLRRKGHHVTTHGVGLVASMATLIMQAGDVRILDKNAWFMVHEISAGAMGKSSEMEDQLKFVKRLQERALDIYTERTNLSRAQIARRWRKTDDWMSADEALKYGYVDSVE